MRFLLLLLSVLLLPSAAAADTYLVSLSGMVCMTCQPKVESAFANLEGVARVKALTSEKGACVTMSETPPPTVAELQKSLQHLPEYKVTKVSRIDTCPFDAGTNKRPVKLWRDTNGIDAAVVTHRDTFELAEAIVPGKYTIIDFGADWCSPCRIAEKRLKTYLAEHEGVAVRAAAMEGQTPDATFALPVAKQHLKNAAGLPYFLLYSPNGKQLYRGQNLDKVFSIIEKAKN